MLESMDTIESISRFRFANLDRGTIYMDSEVPDVANQPQFTSCHTSLLRLTSSGELSYISPELSDLIGISSPELIQMTAKECQRALHDWLQAGESLDYLSKDGFQYHFSHHCVELPDEDTETHLFTNITSVIELQHENSLLKEQARQLQLIDKETSLLTHRALLLVLEAQVSRCRRYESPLSVLMLDLGEHSDKAIDKLRLLKISQLLKEQLRWSDLVARSANNQFTVILPETDSQDARTLVQKLTDIISHWDENSGIAFGLAEWKKGINAADVLQLCEENLLESKANNDNQDVA
jgi:diguanylate cyclase (GGDEF)-like protein